MKFAIGEQHIIAIRIALAHLLFSIVDTTNDDITSYGWFVYFSVKKF